MFNILDKPKYIPPKMFSINQNHFLAIDTKTASGIRRKLIEHLYHCLTPQLPTHRWRTSDSCRARPTSPNDYNDSQVSGTASNKYELAGSPLSPGHCPCRYSSDANPRYSWLVYQLSTGPYSPPPAV